MAYRLVRSLVYKRGVGIRETVWVGVWFGKTNSVGVDLFVVKSAPMCATDDKIEMGWPRLAAAFS